MKKKLVVGLGAIALVVPLLASCGSSDGGVYTLREYDSSTPTNWNPHTWEMSNDQYIPGYTEIGFIDSAYDPDNGGYKWTYEMATAISDVTADQDADFKTKWGIADGDTQRVYEIDLNKDAKFQDGTAITADTYVESMKRDLDPFMKNYRATTYYTGDVALAGGLGYFYGDGKTSYHSVPDSADLLKAGFKYAKQGAYLDWATSFVLESSGWFKGDKIADIATGGADAKYFQYTDDTGSIVNVVSKYSTPVALDATVIADLKKIPLYSYFSGDDTIESVFGSYYLTAPTADWNTVGLLKKDDNTLLYVTAKQCSDFRFKSNMTTLWLVDNDLYDSLKDTTGELTTCSYGTSLESYMAFGPYKLDSFEKDKQIKFSRNENWYGWKDGKHKDQYQATNIVMDVISEHSSALLAFQNGELDSVSLEPADLSKYSYSDQIRHTPETYTMRLVFDSNIKDLKALEATANDGSNKQILAEQDFRKAISLSVNRKDFNAKGTSGNEAAFGLLSSLYYYNVENDPTSIYRNTNQAKQAIVDLYGIEYGEGKTYATLDAAYKAVTGLDVAAAKTCFQAAYTKAVADGHYTKGQKIVINIGYYDASYATTIAQISTLNANVAAATVGTDLEGMITFAAKTYNGKETRYDAIRAGEIECSNCAWGGAAFYPFDTFDVYMGRNGYEYDESRSWDPKKESFSLTYDFNFDGSDETLTKTYDEWQASIESEGDYYDQSTDPAMQRKLYILSRLEYNLLNRWQFAILGVYGTASLFSYKISYPVDVYNIMYGYGGIRYLHFNYSDKTWDEYVAKQGGTLNYE
jgi:oligopeptide transport system substrate-binding protein